jgi:hypothetical protein
MCKASGYNPLLIFLLAVEPAITPDSPFQLPEKAKISLKSG